LDLRAAETQKTRTEVLERVDLMPNVSQSNKDKLYASVDRARKMGKLVRITFPSGKTALLPEEAHALKTQIDSPGIVKLRDDPTAVFVLLGYADPKGDPQKNLVVSQARADAVLAAMRDKCGVVNVMHAVGMGASTLVDAQALDKNRAVEVWAVLP
jgi:outer membrane protein OmpA-like peptidoglycan-associated protein